MKNLLFVEKYRPSHIDECIGNPDQLVKFKEFIDTGVIPNLLLYGPPGCGKTTIARILVNSISCDYIVINASDENSIDTVRTKIKTFATTLGFNGMKIVVLEEADYITRQGQAALRALIEETSDNARFILTCNYVDKIIDPIVSRMQQFKIELPPKATVGKHIVSILDKEEVNYEVKQLVPFVQTFYPDLRKILNEIQLHISNNVLKDLTTNANSSTYIEQIIEELQKQGTKSLKFNKIRQLVADAKMTSYTELFRAIYANMDKISPNNVHMIILYLAEGQFREDQVPDKEINAMAVISQILELT